MMQIDQVFQAQARTRRPRAARYLSSTAFVTLIAFGAAGAVSAQQWTGAVDSDYGTAGNWVGGVVPGAGNANNALVGAVVNDVANVAAGDAFTPGALAAEANATVNIDGSLTTTTDISGAATVNVDGNGADDGAGNDQLVGNVAVRQDGTLQVNANGTVDGNVAAGGTTVTVGIADGGNVTGNVTMTRGNLTVNGIVGGDLTTTGAPGSNVVSVGPTGVVAGRTALESTGFTSAGVLGDGITANTGTTASVTGGSIGSTAGNAITVNGGALTVGAGVTASGDAVLNGSQSAGSLTNNGTIAGDVTANNGVFTTTDTVFGDVTQNGGGVVNARGFIVNDVTVNSGDFNVTGSLAGINNVTNSGRINVVGGPVTVSGTVINSGRINVVGGSMTAAGTVTNTGNIAIGNGRAFNFGAMNNSGRIGLGAGVPGTITATIGGGVAGSAGSTLDLQNGAAGDTMIVQGGVSGTNTVAVNLDLTTTNAGFADVLDVNGQLDDNVTVNVDSVLGPLGYTLQETPITVVNADSFGGSLTTTLTGDLPQGPSGLVLYNILNDTANADVQVQSQINPAIGGVAAAFSSVQNIVGTVVNRPSGAYVSGIAFDSPNNCSTGIWGRTIGGRVNTDSETSNALGTTVGSSGRLDYAGLQGGADFGCFEAFDGGWDISGGVLVGAATGEFLEKASGLRTTGDFDQYFLGGYVAAAKGNWSGEMQLRYGNTDFTLNNTDLAVRDADTSVDSYALSGSVTYRQDLAPGLALLPSVGFNVTDSDSASVALTNPGGVRVGTLTVEDHTNVTGFLGATLSRTTVNEAAGSATNAFLTGTYYIDGSDARDTTVTVGAAPNTASTSLETSEIGDFAELSAGGSIVRLVGNGPGGVRQVNYSVRVDARYGDDLDGVGITGQVRYQF